MSLPEYELYSVRKGLKVGAQRYYTTFWRRSGHIEYRVTLADIQRRFGVKPYTILNGLRSLRSDQTPTKRLHEILLPYWDKQRQHGAQRCPSCGGAVHDPARHAELKYKDLEDVERAIEGVRSLAVHLAGERNRIRREQADAIYAEQGLAPPDIAAVVREVENERT